MNWTVTNYPTPSNRTFKSLRPPLIASCNTFIITVPTDIHPDKSPNLEPLIAASNLVGEYLKKGDLVIYESTTYPDCTEEVCVPIFKQEKWPHI